MNITVPLDWEPRPYQMPLWTALEQGCRRAAVVWHRRAGKDLFSLNFLATQLFQRVGIYWHVLPTYRQGRQVIWEGKTYDGRPFLSYFPEETITRKRDDEMTLWFANGSRYQVIGADEPDRLVGANPIGIIFSEWSLMSPRVWELTWPILAENDGFAIFIYTPRGRNHGFRTLESAKRTPSWFHQTLTVDDTKAVDEAVIEEARVSGMPKEMIAQEFWCSFDAPLAGSYFGDQMEDALKAGRISNVPWEPTSAVTTAWDLGVGDATAIWFVQQVGKEVRVIDYYQSSGVGLDHYAKVLSEKPYAYSDPLAPHDMAVRELGSGGKSRTEMARSLGLRMRVNRRLSVEDGINAVRALLPRCWFDQKKCEKGIQAMREYTKQRLAGEQGPDGEAIYRDKPKHDWTSHPADAFRTLAIGLRPERQKRDELSPKLAIV